MPRISFIIIKNEPDHICAYTHIRHTECNLELLFQEKVGGLFCHGHRISIIPSYNTACDFGSADHLWSGSPGYPGHIDLRLICGAKHPAAGIHVRKLRYLHGLPCHPGNRGHVHRHLKLHPPGRACITHGNSGHLPGASGGIPLCPLPGKKVF